MVVITEYQIPLPLQVEEYQVGQLYAVAKASEQETTGEDGVEIVKNEPYEKENGEKGQYTSKIYHLGKRLPGWLASILPKDLKEVHEEAWNGYPNCKTVIKSPYLGEKFELCIESRHFPFDPTEGFKANALGLDAAVLKKRTVVPVDIAFDPVDEKKHPQDPKKFKSTKTGRGPLTEKGWWTKIQPCMVCYKLVNIKVDYALVGGKVAKWIDGFERDLFTTFHRRLFCWLDEWYGLSIADVRRMEEETKAKNLAKLKAKKEKESGAAPAKPLDLEHDAEAIAAAEKVAAEGSDTASGTSPTTAK